MRPKTSTMLQQNNNNNYPCLSMSGSTQEMLQKCSRAALPFPSRLELGDLPLIRGLRAWALCSRNRRKPGGLLGSRQAPTASHAGSGSSTSCSKPAGAYLSGEWGRTRYGLPLGLDARQAEIGALVTVATLKTSEGSGKTQTQCLFLQTEKGSCLYSTAKPGSGGTTSAGSSVVGGWLRGKTGGGGRDTSVGRRDIGANPPAHTGTSCVRVGSGRRWRKSGNAAGCEKAGVSRERQQRSREDLGEIMLEERKQVQDKGALDHKQLPSPQQHKKEGVCRPPTCCHNASPKTSAQCRRRAGESQEEHEGGESPSAAKKGVRKEQQKNEEEGGACELGPSSFVLAAPNSDPESNPEEPSDCDAEGNEELKGRNTDSEDEQDTNSEAARTHTGNDGPSETLPDASKPKHDKGSSDGKPAENLCEGAVDSVNGFSEEKEANQGFKNEMQSADVEEEKQSIAQAPAAALLESYHYDHVAVSNCPDLISSAPFTESSGPLEGSICTAERWNMQEEGQQTAEEDHVLMGLSDETNTVNPHEENKTSASPLRTKYPSSWKSDCPTVEPEPRDELVSHADKVETRLNLETWTEAGGNDKEQCTSSCPSPLECKTNCAAAEKWRLQESADGCRDETEEDGDSQTSISQVKATGRSSTNVTNAACADPFTSPALSQANPAPPLPPLGSMATGLPCVAAAEEAQEDGVTTRDGEGGQEGPRRHQRELEGETGSTVASEGGRKEQQEEDEEFGVFMQAEGEPTWSESFAVSASVPCGSRESVALGSRSTAAESTCWTSGGTDGSAPRSDDTWTAFPLESSHGPDAAGQWWPSGAVEERRDELSAGHNGVRVFAEAFPSLPGPPCDPCDPGSVPTLTQLLGGRASQDQGLLDSFHDLNKLIGWRYKRAGSASRDLLLRTLHLEQPHTESRAAPWTANRRLSPGLPSANQNAHSAAAKRRLSYDYNRNIME